MEGTKRSICGAAILVVAGLLAVPVAAQQPFTPTAANDPETCKELWKDVGLPEYARPDERDATIVCHERYVLSHNNETKTPHWVWEMLTEDQITGTGKRPKISFVPEKNVAKDKAAVDADYKKSGFDRGHQAPSDDFKKKAEWMVESFILSNIVPQVGKGFNQHIWKKLEELTRAIARERGTVYVITGPIYRDDEGKAPTITKQFNKCGNEIKLTSPGNTTEICAAKNKDPNAKCDDGVAVPVGLYKIIYDPAWPRVNAYILPNRSHEAPKPVEYLKKFQATVHAVERFTGIEFFRELPARTQKMLTLECGQMMLH